MVDSMSINSAIEAATAETSHKLRMDRMYRGQRHIYDATRAYYLLGRNELIESLQPPHGGSVLEIGCGTGRNVVRVAERYQQARVFGVDISDEMLVSAGKAVERSGHRARIKLAQGDAVSFSAAKAFGQAQFDRIFFSYTLSMIPAWQASLAHAATLLKPNGRMHIVDFGDCARLPSVFRTGLRAWLNQFHVTPHDDLPQAAHDLAQHAGLQAAITSSHRGYALHLVLEKTG
jgi:S-adenosylmethionine-diacylgycerolhomoserine-N-methlytransferase